MDDLPPELLSSIAEYCLPSSLKDLRLVNHRCYDASTPILFTHFHLAIFDESINQLIAFSKSNLARYVKRCTVYLDRLPEWNQASWVRAIYARGVEYWRAYGDCPHMDSGLSTGLEWSQYNGTAQHEVLLDLHPIHRREMYSHFSPRQLNDAFKFFTSIKNQQIRLVRAGLGVVLKECFMMFPNLDSVTCTVTSPSRPRDLKMCAPPWDRLQSRILTEPRVWAARETNRADSSTQQREFAHRVSFLIFEAMAFRASFAGTKPITKLELHLRQDAVDGLAVYESWETFMTHHSPTTSLPLNHSYAASLSRVLEGFQSLTHIDWSICQTPTIGYTIASLAKETAHFLRRSRNLRSICLSFYDELSAPPVTSSVTPGDAAIDKLLTGQPLWPYLHHLRLSFRTSHTRLLALFQTVSHTLTSLALTDMEVGNAQELIIRTPQVLNLEEVQFRSIWHTRESSGIQCLFPDGLNVPSKLEKDVRSYLLRQVNQCPNLGLY